MTDDYDVTGPGSIDLEGVRLTIAAVIRWLPAVAVVGVLAWLLAAVVEGNSDEHRAVVSLGLTDEVVWPFYDSVLANQQTYFDDGSIIAAAESVVGAPVTDFVLTTGENQSLSMISISVKSTSADAAESLAEAVADALVAANMETQTADAQHDLEQALSTASTAPSGAGDGAVSEAQFELDGIDGRIERVQRPRVIDDKPTVPRPIVAGGVAALLATTVVPTLERRYGKLRNGAQIRRVWPSAGVIVVGERRPLLRGDLDALRVLSENGTASVVVVIATESVGEDIRHELDDFVAGGAVTVVSCAAAAANTVDALVGAHTVAVLARQRRTTLRLLDSIRADLQILGRVPDIVVLQTNG